jgi:hypothetical protein
MTRHPTLLIGGLLALLSLPALAGRPLSSDDAGTADAGTCQVEAWGEKAGPDRATVIAPACGLLPGLELGADYSVPRPRNGVRAEAGLALKLAPERWKLSLAGRELSLGLKAGGGWLKPEGAGWQASGSSLLGLATFEACT